MKKMQFVFAVFTILTASAFTLIQPVNWTLKEDAYSVSFKGDKIKGVLKGLKTTISFDEMNPGKSKFTATLDVVSINTGNGIKNSHAKSESALNAKQFPEISFESVSVSGKAGVYNAIGKLTIKGITKEISLPFTFENKGREGLFKGHFNIVTKDFNVIRSGTPNVLEIDLVIPVTRQ